jgi:carbamoyltransferase
LSATKEMNHVIGISAYYHDSAAALITDGQVTKAAAEERFSRQKNDATFPHQALNYCLSNLDIADVSAFVFYEKPFLKFERLLETYMAYAPRGFGQFRHSITAWMNQKLFLKQTLKKELSIAANLKISELPPLLFTQHHQSHAASAYYCSPYQEAAVLCVDGVGEWATTSAWQGVGNELRPLWQINFPHSIGLLYSAFTYYCGFEVNSGEYKLMGLAPYGKPIYSDVIQEHLIDIKSDGTFRLNMDYFDFCTGLKMINTRFEELFGRPARKPETNISQFDMDVAASIQQVTEVVMMRLASTLQSETQSHQLCLAGGVALNCVSNGKLRRQNLFREVWAQPAAGDAGGAIGAALCAWHEKHPGTPRDVSADGMQNCLLGPSYDQDEIITAIDAASIKAEQLEWQPLYETVADLLASGQVIAWYQGRSEFGPRALGSRSILGDARNETIQKTMNLKVKNRESFRPFAPIVLAEEVSNYFDSNAMSPFMSFVEYVKPSHLVQSSSTSTGIDRVNDIRSTIPAVTHIDNSARLQTVTQQQNPKLHGLLSAFHAKTNCPVLINTSFNVRDEPIVETPANAIECFLKSGIDVLVMDRYLIRKKH